METMETMETLGTMETRVREFGPFIEIENDMYRFRERVYKPDEELDNGIIALLVVGGNMARDNHHYLAEALSECGYEARTLNTLFENSAYAKVLGKRSRDVRIKDSQNIFSMAIDAEREAQELYRTAAKIAGDNTDLAEMFLMLAEDEERHEKGLMKDYAVFKEEWEKEHKTD